jgi:2-C-methyl-D-erythritol 4-phosphate cytidylyltransferase/2-C-methyl-D-erythritol 2,4-cyclodiphosphate synthase
MDSAESHGASVPLLPLNDALKVVDMGEIVGTIDRSKLHITQTPQAFPTKLLLEILGKAEMAGADEAEVWLNAGRPLAYVRGDMMNFKITYPEDLRFAERVLSGTSVMRTGLGYDIHPLVPGRPLVIGGVNIPFSLGLSGHSDGDLLCHAVSDSLLGAAGFPDIGTLFPSSDQSLKNACSLDLMETVVKMLAGSGFHPRSVDAVINAQIPKLGPWIGAIESGLAKILFPKGNGIVSVKAKSGEKTGSIGNGEAIACWVVATIYSETLSRPII